MKRVEGKNAAIIGIDPKNVIILDGLGHRKNAAGIGGEQIDRIEGVRRCTQGLLGAPILKEMLEPVNIIISGAERVVFNQSFK